MANVDNRSIDPEPYTTVPKTKKGYQIPTSNGGFAYINPGNGEGYHQQEGEIVGRNDVYAKTLFGARMPIPSYRDILKQEFRSAQVVKMSSTGSDAAMLSDPYSNYVKAHIEDAYRKDATIRRGVDLYVKFLLGKRTNTVIDVNKEFMDIDLQEQVIADTFNEQEVNKTKTWMDRINRQVKFHQATYAGVTQSVLAGRAAIAVDVGAEGIPESLKILNWRKLGRVFADPETWQFIGVEYADRRKEDPLRAEEIIYLPHADYHISPNTLYYGLSLIEPLLDVSHTNRIINQEDLKEGARVAWAKNGIIKFLPNTPLAKMKEFVQNFRPGWHGTTQNVTIEEHDINVDLTGLAKVREENEKVLQRGVRVPSFVMGYEEIPNKATAETTIHVFRETEINYARTWLQDLLEPQWYDSLLKIRYPDLDLNKMWIKAKLEFEDIVFESLKDRVDALLPLVQAGYIPIEKFLKMLDMDDIIPQIQAQQRLMEQRRREELEMMRLEQEERQDRDRSTSSGEEDTTERENNEDEEDDEDDETERPPTRRRTVRTGAILQPIPVIEAKQEQTPDNQNEKFSAVLEEIKQAANVRQASIQDEQLRMAREEHDYKMQMLRKINEKLEKLSSNS